LLSDEECVESASARKTCSRGNAETTGAGPHNREEKKTAGNKKERKQQYMWKNSKLEKRDDKYFVFTWTPQTIHENLQYPIGFFLFYFTNEVLSHIANQSALYSMQMKPEKALKITTVDIVIL